MVAPIPHLSPIEGSQQLIVHGKPYLIRGGELQNSSMSSAAFMKPIWPRLVADGVNTVLGAVTWDQIEEVEGHFTFDELDQIILDARSNGLHLVLLWFGAFKNGMSTYAPPWVKKDATRFPRVKLRKAGGKAETIECLSVFDRNTCDADARAFQKLMQHVKEIDEVHSTVILVQVENEIGILGDSRDASKVANEIFSARVPEDFKTKLKKDWNSLHHALKANLKSLSDSLLYESEATWSQLLGDSPQTDEIFMAYHLALYVEEVARAGKQAYPLPMYTNVWQNYGGDDRDPSFPVVAGGGDEPGSYPSGGGTINVLDIWQIFAPSLSFIAPDIYLNDYSISCAKYRHRNQPLFIPEQRRDDYGARRIWEAFGSFQAIGTAPFGIDTVEMEHKVNPFKKHYLLLSQIEQHVLKAQRKPGSSVGFYFDDYHHDDIEKPKKHRLGTWDLEISRSFVLGKPSPGCGMIIHLDHESRFLLIGWGFQVRLRSTKSSAYFTGILKFEEKELLDPFTGEMMTGRRLNGDETRSGQFAIMPSEVPDYGGFPISITIPARTGIAEVEVYALEE